MWASRIVRQFAGVASPRLINIKVEYEGEIIPFAFPLHTKLAKNLERARVPLEF